MHVSIATTGIKKSFEFHSKIRMRTTCSIRCSIIGISKQLCSLKCLSLKALSPCFGGLHEDGSEMYSEPFQTSKLGQFSKEVDD